MKYLLLLLIMCNVFAINNVNINQTISATTMNNLINIVNHRKHFVGSVKFFGNDCTGNATSTWSNVCVLGNLSTNIIGNISSQNQNITFYSPAGHLRVVLSTGLVDISSTTYRLNARLFDSVHNIESSFVTIHSDRKPYKNSGSIVFDIIIPEAGTYTFNLQVNAIYGNIDYKFRTEHANPTFFISYSPNKM